MKKETLYQWCEFELNAISIRKRKREVVKPALIIAAFIWSVWLKVSISFGKTDPRKIELSTKEDYFRYSPVALYYANKRIEIERKFRERVNKVYITENEEIGNDKTP